MARVSVNICCYNGEKYIAEAIDSVLSQTWPDFEIIVINDGSRDASEHKVLAFKDQRVKYFAQENRGLSESRNRAIALSSGEFIALLDQDDFWEPEKLELQLQIMDANPAVGVVYSDAYIVDEQGSVHGAGQRRRYRRGRISRSLLKTNYILCPTVMFRATVLQKTGKFRTDLKIGEEYDLYLRASRVCDFDFVDKPLARYRLHRNNTNTDLAKSYADAIVCLADFSTHAEDSGLVGSARRYADVNRLKLAAVLIWNQRNSEALIVLKSLNPSGLWAALGFLFQSIASSPSWLSRILLLPLRLAGIVR